MTATFLHHASDASHGGPSADGEFALPVLRDPASARAQVADIVGAEVTVALVPTMGALHQGHLALVAEARRHADAVVASVFVNPAQFGAGEDFDRYPRALEHDAELLAGAGASAVFAPTAAAMYPHGAPRVLVTAGELAHRYEGAIRPIHFDGVLTVVAKLLHIIGPQVAVFGRKDAQQLFLIRTMVAELNLPVRIVGVPIVREDDGLARSSRNAYLSDEDRAHATVLFRALSAVRDAASQGRDAAIGAGVRVIEHEPRTTLDYLDIVDPATFQTVADGFTGQALAIVAARVGDVRLIDNVDVSIPR